MTAADESASWPARAGALLVDLLPGAAVLAASVLVALSVPLRGSWWWICAGIGAAAILWTAFNRFFLPVISGHTVGRGSFGITVVHRHGGAVGPWGLLLRDLAHLADTVPLFIGWLWPLSDARKRTFADLLVRTESRRSDGGSRNWHRGSAATISTAAALCVVCAVISYAVVGQRERATAQAIAQISAQGPQLVVQILSYRPETIQVDFDHARSLASDRYREQLSAMQQAALKVGPQPNEYSVTESSVLTAAPDRATMLVFLQGRRGAPPGQRYLAASVRASFVKTVAAQWRVDDLAVVADFQTVGATS
ncbi:MAG: hypothetical protein CK429_13385 [Mycobacterium sp.]|nr:MAG: hypothetical protein CK429_13385 [Mycobacterium sp.]